MEIKRPKIWILPLEPLEERYTIQWIDWFKTEFENNNLNFEFINAPTLTTKVEDGKVLDAAGTNFYKFNQLSILMTLFKERKISPNDIIYTMDFWYPGLESIRYTSMLMHIPVKIYAHCHACSVTEEDFAQPMHSWAKYFEKGWITICNGIFVATEYAKRKLITGLKLEGYNKKIHVTGNPFYPETCESLLKEIDYRKKQNIIIFPNRFDYEKGIYEFMTIMKLVLETKRNDIKFVITTSRDKLTQDDKVQFILNGIINDYPNQVIIKSGLNKAEYYYELLKSKVFISTTHEEWFGYCLQEALTFKVIPLVIDDFSHKEILRGWHSSLYSSKEPLETIANRLINKIDNYVIDQENIKSIFQVPYQFTKSISKMIEIMLK